MLSDPSYSLLLVGTGSYSRVLSSLFKPLFDHCKDIHHVNTLLEKTDQSVPVFHSVSSFLDKTLTDHSQVKAILAIGNHYGFERCSIADELSRNLIEICTLHHKSSFISDDAIVSPSTIIHPGATIMPFTKISEYTIINTGATVDHDVIISRGCHIMGSSYIAGRVSIGEYTTIGSNSTIFPDITIGRNCYLGAGSTLRCNMPDNSVYVGSPARYIKGSRELKDVLFT